MWQRANGKTLGFLSTRSLSCCFPVYLKVVHRRSDAQIELDARLSTPILTTGLAVSDALLKPGLLELSSSTWDTVTRHNSWMTTFGPVALLKLVISGTEWQGDIYAYVDERYVGCEIEKRSYKK